MKSRADIVIEAPYAKLHVTEQDLGDHAYMRAQQLAVLLELMEGPEGATTELWMAQQLAHEVLASITGMLGVKP